MINISAELNCSTVAVTFVLWNRSM